MPTPGIRDSATVHLKPVSCLFRGLYSTGCEKTVELNFLNCGKNVDRVWIKCG